MLRCLSRKTCESKNRFPGLRIIVGYLTQVPTRFGLRLPGVHSVSLSKFICVSPQFDLPSFEGEIGIAPSLINQAVKGFFCRSRPGRRDFHKMASGPDADKELIRNPSFFVNMHGNHAVLTVKLLY